VRKQLEVPARALNALGATDVASRYEAGVVAPIRRVEERQQQRVASERVAAEPLRGSPAAQAGGILAGGLATVGPGVAARGTAAGAALLPTTVKGNALAGAAYGVAAPVASDGERGGNMLLGAGLGAGLSALPAGANALASRVRAARLPAAERAAGRAIQAEASGPLDIQQSAVPGVRRTLGDATMDPGVMQLENTVRGQRESLFRQADDANNAARVAALRQIAGTDAEFAAAQGARNIAAEPLYTAARAKSVPLDDELSGVISRLPASVVSKAKEISKMQGKAFPSASEPGDAAEGVYYRYNNREDTADNGTGYMMFAEKQRNVEGYGKNLWTIRPKEGDGATVDARDDGFRAKIIEAAERNPELLEEYRITPEELADSFAPDDIVNTADGWDNQDYVSWLWDNVAEPNGIMTVKTYDGAVTFDPSIVKKGMPSPEITGDQLHTLKIALDDAISRKGEGSLGNAEKRIAMQVKDDLVSAITTRIPEYGQALAEYRNLSTPVGRMQIGRYALEKGDAAVPDAMGNQRLTPARFESVADLDNTAGKATKFKGAKAKDYLTADDIQTFRSIQDDLRRQSDRIRNPSPGPNTAGKLETSRRVLARQAVGRVIPGVGGALDYIQTRLDDATQAKLAELLANPDQAKRVLATLSEADKKVVRELLMRLSGAAGRDRTTNEALMNRINPARNAPRDRNN
jgi:hypothetical protein